MAEGLNGRGSTDGLYRDLLESAPDAIVVVDADGRIRLVNRQTESLFGYDRSDLVGKKLEILVPNRVAKQHAEFRKQYFDDPQARPMDAGLHLTARRKDGTEFPVDISLSPLQTEEGMLVSAAVRDITDRKKAEQEREVLRKHQSQRLESLGQLAGGVAHDFNNLLAAILNYASLIVDEPDATSVAQDAEEIIRAAERGAALTHQLLIFGRRELVKPEVLDLNVVVVELEKLLRRTIGEHIELRSTLDADLWQIHADPSGIDQVVMNLAVNARDAMPGGGTLSIGTANADMSLAFETAAWNIAPGRYVELAVSDTGEGMTPEVIARAFEPFFTTKPKGKGSGLGLATVYGIVTQAGGDVRVYSEPGVGTTVSVYLPATDQQAEPRESKPGPEDYEGHGETILVVEDEDQVRAPTIRALTKHGYAVLAAANGREALDLIQAHPSRVDLVLADVVMPHMSGPDMVDVLQTTHPETLVLFTSGYPQDLLERGTISSGVPLLEKPYTTRQLLGRLRAMLDSAK